MIIDKLAGAFGALAFISMFRRIIPLLHHGFYCIIGLIACFSGMFSQELTYLFSDICCNIL